MSTILETSRRDFLKTSAAVTGGLMVGFSIHNMRSAQAAGTLRTPNAWVHISDDNVVTLITARSEMGQGVYTSMPMLIAEELNVDLKKIQVAVAPPDKVKTNALHGAQLAGGTAGRRSKA